jgi:hypothetical protein
MGYVEKLAILDVLYQFHITDNYIRYKQFPFHYQHNDAISKEAVMDNFFVVWEHFSARYTNAFRTGKFTA